ncbi:MAG: lmo0937 family membrane protein [Gemmatimonadaceae bacterium]
MAGASAFLPGRSGSLRRRRSHHAGALRRRGGLTKSSKPVIRWVIFFLAVALWLAGVITAVTAGGLLHLLLVVAVVALVWEFLRGRRGRPVA